MADHLSYEASIKRAYYGLGLLAVITLIEVAVSLFVGPIGSYFKIIAGIALIGLAVYKAFFIIADFMHMKYEFKSLAMTVLLPTVLLVWAIIAFLMEGSYWNKRRTQIVQFNKIEGKAPAYEAPQDTAALKGDTTKVKGDTAKAKNPAMPKK